MKVLIYPADNEGCGHHRLIWPAGYATATGSDIEIEVVTKENRRVEFAVQGDTVKKVIIPDDVDVVVFQRITHFYLAQAVEILRQQGVAVVVDVDDDLTAVHPSNDAFKHMHPSMFGKIMEDGNAHMHSWLNLTSACNAATMVTVSTPSLLRKYAIHGRGRVLPNYLADCYYDVPHEDSDEIVWPASGHSHPNDPHEVGPAVARLVREGARFTTYGVPEVSARLFGLEAPTHEMPGDIHVTEWAQAIAQHGIGIAPLADTKFNHSKSWLKPLELSAVGVPWVGSPRAEYQRLHDLGCGLLVDKPRRWYATLDRLRKDEVERKELGAAGRAVAETLRLRDHAWRWAEAWSDAAALQRS